MKKRKAAKKNLGRVVVVRAPTDWNKMFQDDPEGPDIQAFLDQALESVVTGGRAKTPTKGSRKKSTSIKKVPINTKRTEASRKTTAKKKRPAK